MELRFNGAQRLERIEDLMTLSGSIFFFALSVVWPCAVLQIPLTTEFLFLRDMHCNYGRFRDLSDKAGIDFQVLLSTMTMVRKTVNQSPGTQASRILSFWKRTAHALAHSSCRQH